ncbi:MAG TPA: DegQ family serine endoprotease [Candidatus Sulfotelmatobacter sp.]|nr:DegQ family serine endoprotease [Candidatus Sulfotelmatobacter sp.]
MKRKLQPNETNMKTNTNSFHIRLAAVGLASAVITAGAAIGLAQASQTDTRAADAKIPLEETSIPRDGLPRGSYAPIVDKVSPAVVKIEVTSTKDVQMPGMPGFNDPFWRQFFGGQFGQPQDRQEVEHGLGSGVIVTSDGYILTNNHVVDGAKELKVTLADGREFTAKVVGHDEKTDIAVVKIDAKDLPTIPMADSRNVEVGDVVLAVGNPFGVGETVTEGIVSAKNRGGMGIEHYENFIQTDAPINPGNSGGALVDIDGRLVGINTAIMSRSGGSDGIGFAIPSDLARSVMESLIKYGYVTRGYLGVAIQDVTPELAPQFDVKDNKGAIVSEVVADSPADKAGIKDGDVIVKFNGDEIADSRQLQLDVADAKPGSDVPVQVLRNGDEKTLDVTIKPQPGTEQLADSGSQNNSDNGTLNGVTVTDLNSQARAQFNIPDDVKGALITQVDPTSASAQAGLQPGEVIESINRHPVANADDAVQLTEHPKSKETLVRIWANGGSQYVVVNESDNLG